MALEVVLLPALAGVATAAFALELTEFLKRTPDIRRSKRRRQRLRVTALGVISLLLAGYLASIVHNRIKVQALAGLRL